MCSIRHSSYLQENQRSIFRLSGSDWCLESPFIAVGYRVGERWIALRDIYKNG